MQIIMNQTKVNERDCITFKKRDKEKNYVKIGYYLGCWSHIGKLVKAQEQPISIDTDCLSVEIIVHELVHALGFHHEHSRPDRDDYVKVINENIIEGTEKSILLIKKLAIVIKF